jgi:hypothetical protein
MIPWVRGALFGACILRGFPRGEAPTLLSAKPLSAYRHNAFVIPLSSVVVPLVLFRRRLPIGDTED